MPAKQRRNILSFQHAKERRDNKKQQERSEREASQEEALLLDAKIDALTNFLHFVQFSLNTIYFFHSDVRTQQIISKDEKIQKVFSQVTDKDPETRLKKLFEIEKKNFLPLMAFNNNIQAIINAETPAELPGTPVEETPFSVIFRQMSKILLCNKLPQEALESLVSYRANLCEQIEALGPLQYQAPLDAAILPFSRD